MTLRSLPLLVALTLSGCARDEALLVEPTRWVEADADADPFADRPDTIDCSPLSWSVENLAAPSLEIDSTDCDYLALTQPMVEDVRVGEEVEVRLWHNDLIAPEAAVTHVAVAFDGVTQWEVRLDIPVGQVREAALIVDTFEATEEIPVDTEVIFHLHNHGQNSYNLVHVKRLGRDSE